MKKTTSKTIFLEKILFAIYGLSVCANVLFCLCPSSLYFARMTRHINLDARPIQPSSTFVIEKPTLPFSLRILRDLHPLNFAYWSFLHHSKCLSSFSLPISTLYVMYILSLSFATHQNAERKVLTRLPNNSFKIRK